MNTARVCVCAQAHMAAHNTTGHDNGEYDLTPGREVGGCICCVYTAGLGDVSKGSAGGEQPPGSPCQPFQGRQQTDPHIRAPPPRACAQIPRKASGRAGTPQALPAWPAL